MKVEVDALVLRAMGDDISKEMYVKRIAYSNGINKAMEQIVNSVMHGAELLQFMDKNQDNLYVFGAGMLGKDFVATWSWKYKFKGFIDNNSKIWGEIVSGIPVLPLHNVDKDNAAVIIMNKFCWKEILGQLIDSGLKEELILNVGEIYRQFNKQQYFDLDCMEITDKENFVDCGVLDGETSLNLYEKYGGVNKIWMFEPDKQNIPKIKRNFERVREIDYEIIEKRCLVK